MAILKDIIWQDHVLRTRMLKPGEEVKITARFRDPYDEGLLIAPTRALTLAGFRVIDENSILFWLNPKEIKHPKYDFEILQRDLINGKSLESNGRLGFSFEYRWEPSRELIRA